MKTNKIALLCCAVIVAAGFGLNIQNALSDYGISEESLSLVAIPGSGSNSNSNSNSNTNASNDDDYIENHELGNKFIPKNTGGGSFAKCCKKKDNKWCNKKKQDADCN